MTYNSNSVVLGNFLNPATFQVTGTPATNVHVGSNTVNYTISNTGGSAADKLYYTASGTGSLAGAITPTSGTIASTGTTTAAISATYNAVAGPNNNGTLVVSDPNSTTNTNGTVTTTIAQTGWRLASAAANLGSVTLGTIHVGGKFVSQPFSITNTATADGYSENLDVTSASGTATLMGSFTGLAPQQSSNSLSAVISGTQNTPGSATGNLTLNLTSDGAGNSGLGTSSAGTSSVAVSGLVYSGTSTWNTNGGGSWGTLTTAFGTNWGANQGSPGLDASFTNTDTATFGSALSTGNATVTLDGASPSLKAITFNNAGHSYTIATGTGNGNLILNNGASPVTVSVTGSHTISAVISGSSGLSLTSGGTLTLSGNNTYNGPTYINAGGTLTLGINNAIPSNSAVTIGGDGTTYTGNGKLDLQTYYNAIGSLAFGSSSYTNTLAFTLGTDTTTRITTSGAVNLNNASLSFNDSPNGSVGKYTLIKATGALTGTIAGSAPTNYRLNTITGRGGELDLIHRATPAIALTSPTAGTRYLTNSNIPVTGTVSNTAPLNSDPLAVNLSNTPSLTGTLTPALGSVIPNSSTTFSGTFNAGSSTGPQTINITETDSTNGSTLTASTGAVGVTVVAKRTYTTTNPSTIDVSTYLAGAAFSVTTPTVISSTGTLATTTQETVSGSASNGPISFTIPTTAITDSATITGTVSGTTTYAGGSVSLTPTVTSNESFSASYTPNPVGTINVTVNGAGYATPHLSSTTSVDTSFSGATVLTGTIKGSTSPTTPNLASHIVTTSGGVGTSPSLVFGTNNTEATIVWANTTTDKTITETWRTRTKNELYGGGSWWLGSDVVSIKNISGATYVLELTYDKTIIKNNAFLAAFNGTTWVKAVTLNTGNSTAEYHPQVQWSSLYTTLGQYGYYDQSGDPYAWAVINFDGQFAVVPEPASLGVLAVGTFGLLKRKRR